jgi:hypothetical protein
MVVLHSGRSSFKTAYLHILFYDNIFGWDTDVGICQFWAIFADSIKLTLGQKNDRLYAIQITSHGAQYLIESSLARDEAYDVM